jgi:tripartite-type tricarboxylate transporter receptor subunit TctC
MCKSKRSFLTRSALLGAGLSASTLVSKAWAQASTWPNKPVKLIVSQPAGAGQDILARFLADQLSKTWGQPVVVENRPGGQNVIGSQAAARSPADGYSLFFGTTAAMVTNSFTFKTLPYDPVKDFVPVRLVGRSPFVIAAGPMLQGKDFGEVIAMAKAQPGAVAIATEGPKTFSGMLADYVGDEAGIKLNHVSYTKASDAIQDVIGGRVGLICLPAAALNASLRGGQLRALAVSTAERVPDLASTPTLAERFPGMEYTGWNGMFAPAGTPMELVSKINRDLEAVLKQPDIVQRLQSMGSFAVTSMTQPEFDLFMRRERERWAVIVKKIGLQAE